jgi:hypothetical protein
MELKGINEFLAKIRQCYGEEVYSSIKDEIMENGVCNIAKLLKILFVLCIDQSDCCAC